MEIREENPNLPPIKIGTRKRSLLIVSRSALKAATVLLGLGEDVVNAFDECTKGDISARFNADIKDDGLLDKDLTKEQVSEIIFQFINPLVPVNPTSKFNLEDDINYFARRAPNHDAIVIKSDSTSKISQAAKKAIILLNGSADVTKISKTFLDHAIRESYRLNMRCQRGQDGKNRSRTSLSKFRFNCKELHPCIAISL